MFWGSESPAATSLPAAFPSGRELRRRRHSWLRRRGIAPYVAEEKLLVCPFSGALLSRGVCPGLVMKWQVLQCLAEIVAGNGSSAPRSRLPGLCKGADKIISLSSPCPVKRKLPLVHSHKKRAVLEIIAGSFTLPCAVINNFSPTFKLSFVPHPTVQTAKQDRSL